MKSKFFTFAWTAFAVTILLALATPATFAQEGEPQVVDEVIAQINNDVITLSMLRREMREFVEAQKQQGVPEQKAVDEVNQHKAEIIASLVNEQLLMQKGKDLGFTDEVEVEVNKRMLEVAKQHNIKSIADLDEALKQNGLDPVAIRQTLRAEIMKQMVLSREVDAKIYYGLSTEELNKYYAANKEKFRKPESVTLSEIWLSLAGKPEAEVRARAVQIVTQARAGGDFGALAAANSEREAGGKRTAPETKGKIGTFAIPDLRADVVAALKDVKAGGVTEPLRTDEAYLIFRVDERTAASSDSTFNENQVRDAITNERMEKERKDYLQSLRTDAYIKIATPYRQSVEPLLHMNESPTKKASADKK
ncbi:MAG: peptidyl-prolyl cis-trans isomerase [Pyrinomonadaceae bacterium]